VLITHDEQLAREAQRVVRLRAGAVESDSPTETLLRSA
jgi:predicted ABC-type transport system involved in lysophospholipase L1 biosynthesis ATPase subunit